MSRRFFKQIIAKTYQRERDRQRDHFQNSYIFVALVVAPHMSRWASCCCVDRHAIFTSLVACLIALDRVGEFCCYCSLLADAFPGLRNICNSYIQVGLYPRELGLYITSTLSDYQIIRRSLFSMNDIVVYCRAKPKAFH